MEPTLEHDGADGRLIYLAENLASLHAAPDLPWLVGRFEFLGEKAIGASLTVLALPDEAGVYRAAETAAPRPATARALWEELGIDALAANEAASLLFARAERAARPLSTTLRELFPGRVPGLAFDEALVAPVTFNRELLGVGVIIVPASELAESMAMILAGHTAVAIHQLRQHEEARRLHSVDRRLWVPDEHYLLSELRRELSRARRYGREVGLAVLRIENEAAFRHQFGDFFTDHLLRRIGGQLLAAVRDSDILGAVAGGFGIVHTDTSDEGTRISAGRLRNSVVEMVKQRFPEAPELSVSMRMAAFPATAESVEDMLLQVGPDEAQEGAAAA